MRLVDMYIEEFIAICDFLRKSQIKAAKGFYIINKKDLEELLNKNKYNTSQDKLKIWKRLNWIETDQDRLTKRIYNTNTGKYDSCIKISIMIYETLKLLKEVDYK